MVVPMLRSSLSAALMIVPETSCKVSVTIRAKVSVAENRGDSILFFPLLSEAWIFGNALVMVRKVGPIRSASMGAKGFRHSEILSNISSYHGPWSHQ